MVEEVSVIEVQLPIELWQRGENVGLRRSRIKGSPRFEYSKTKGKRTAAETHTYGARGEAAFAYALGLDWAGVVDGFTEIPDVEPNWEIRTAPTNKLFKVSPSDSPARLVGFVLNEWGSAMYWIVGYIKASWAQENLPLIDLGRYGAPAHWVKEHFLTPINPGFHVGHGWMRGIDGRWACAFCPALYEGAEP